MKKKKASKPRKEKPATITHTRMFAGLIRKGESGNELVIRSPRWYQHSLNKFKDGEKVTMEIHNRKPKRTEQQNRYYYGAYLPLIAQETGEQNIDRLHELFKGMFLSEGVVDVLGKKVRLKRSTTELSKQEFSEYIMAIEGETGVAAPPTESWDLAPLRDSTDSVSYRNGNRSNEIVENFLSEESDQNTQEGSGLERAKSNRDKKKTT